MLIGIRAFLSYLPFFIHLMLMAMIWNDCRWTVTVTKAESVGSFIVFWSDSPSLFFCLIIWFSFFRVLCWFGMEFDALEHDLSGQMEFILNFSYFLTLTSNVCPALKWSCAWPFHSNSSLIDLNAVLILMPSGKREIVAKFWQFSFFFYSFYEWAYAISAQLMNQRVEGVWACCWGTGRKWINFT